ncbi:MAG: PBP1A family penicillin-binding protein [Oscillospiraceae bacterium]|jgi:penicillin-binding protein 1A|nr:PBP1A family penicillin-binding protein [Oscillospiraceae bacterium]
MILAFLRAAAGIIRLAVKTAAALLLIFVTTGAIFACIFVLYVKANLTTGLDVKLEEFTMSLSSVIFAKNPETEEYEEMTLIKTTEYRVWVDYNDIPLNMENALVAIEDKRFYKHHGVDWYRTSAAFANMFLGMKDNFGGSTITQQLIKNMTGDREATVQRKLTEIFRALEFERNGNDKERIIEWYLNSVYFGNMRYGIGAAANYYFGKEASELSLAECASIVGITNNPSMYDPYQNRAANKKRQENILNVMYEQGYITPGERDRAKREQLVFRRGEESTYTPEDYTWFEEAVISDVIEVISELKGVDSRTASAMLSRGGYQIYSTIDLTIQSYVDQIYQNLDEIPKTSGSQQQLQSAMVIMAPDTGNIVALSGGVGVKEGSRLRSRATVMRRAPGSSIKPLSVYAPAMDSGIITADTRYDDAPDIKLSGTDWYPHNDDYRHMRVINIRTAVVRSRNTVSAQVLDKLTPTASFRFMCDQLGFGLNPSDEAYAPLAVGELTYGATVREMTSAYTMFTNEGSRVEARTFTHLYDANGDLIYENSTKNHFAISSTTAYWMTDILHDAVRYGTGGDASLGSAMPVAGKTGTSGNSKDRWFVGFTPYYTAAVWTGYDIPENINVVERGNPSAKIWKKVMAMVHQDLPYLDFHEPASSYQPAVPGIIQMEYKVICMDDTGAILSEETGAGQVGQSLTFTAPAIEGYIPPAAMEAALTIGENPEKNVVVFRYTSAEPTPEPEPEPTPSDGPPPPDTPSDDGPPDWLPEISPAPVPAPPGASDAPEDNLPYYTPPPADTGSPPPSASPSAQPTDTVPTL